MSKACPPSLKQIAPFLARASELAKVEPAISYWCTYYAVQQAMNSGAQEGENMPFLMGLMDKLETIKAEHANDDAITNDITAASYITSFATKIFNQADEEDQSGKATRFTARKFLAASNFLDLLTIFGDVPQDVKDKIKYAKWKASSISSAAREGVTPTPGGLLEQIPSSVAPEHTVVTDAEAKELEKELEAMDSPVLSASSSPVAATNPLALPPTVPDLSKFSLASAPSEEPDFIESASPPLPPPIKRAPVPVVPASTSSTMDPVLVSQIQKHAKWAISALNYDDYDTARKELKIALAMLDE